MKDNEDFTTNTYWSDKNDLVMSSYAVKSNSGKKNVLLLATMGTFLGITKDDGKKSLHNTNVTDFTKGGAHECEKKPESFCFKPKSRTIVHNVIC